MSGATSPTPQRASDFEPYARSQGLAHYAGAGKAGSAIQHGQYTFAAGGVLAFSSIGFRNMANTTYQVFLQNHTGSGAPKVANSDRKANQITITGPANGDVIDVMIVGRYQGMTGA